MNASVVDSAPDASLPQRIGLVAGGGRFPVLVAEGLARRGVEVVCATLHGQDDPALADACVVVRKFGFARLGPLFRFFRRHEVRELTWAGWIRKESIFARWRWLRLVPDWRMIRFYFVRLRRRDRQNQTILSALAEEFAAEGFELSHSVKYSPELLAPEGVLSRRRPTPAQWEDVRFGWDVAKRMADLDVGQSVVVCEKSTLAVEGIEGTDRNIRRAGEFYRRGGFTVVKVAKDGHDMRFDVPAVGPDTIASMRAAGGAVLCIEAGKTLTIDRAAMLSDADAAAIAVVSLVDGREPRPAE